MVRESSNSTLQGQQARFSAIFTPWCYGSVAKAQLHAISSTDTKRTVQSIIFSYQHLRTGMENLQPLIACIDLSVSQYGQYYLLCIIYQISIPSFVERSQGSPQDKQAIGKWELQSNEHLDHHNPRSCLQLVQNVTAQLFSLDWNIAIILQHF